MTIPITFSGLERRERLLQFVETHERVTITEICRILSISREVILVADHTKCGRIASVLLARFRSYIRL
jgi:DeoR/GlpR family transcriptional regulator of sugar metabolism